ncbi:MAG TPA: Hsp20 family protein [Burkholderiaceae bacterium]|jgi:HSP20 family protein|nr:Hsp20 family protein [Burkholderiaceae bacterium]
MSQLIRREPLGFLVDEFFSDFFNRSGWSVPARSVSVPAVVRARTDVIDKGDKYAVSVDLPGMRKEDIQVSIDGARISISAEDKSERQVKDGDKVLHTERHANSYARSFELPAEVTEEGADASFENGVLQLTLPKRAHAVAKRLAVR